MTVIGFTTPVPAPDRGALLAECRSIERYLESGAIDFFHLRKPDAPAPAITALLENISPALRHRLVVHSAFAESLALGAGGIHLSLRNAAEKVPDGMGSRFFTTRSCHSLKEIAEIPANSHRYITLSPIFDSISKEGYLSRFRLDDCELSNVIAGRNVIALGGVTPDRFCQLSIAKFGGAALLGYLWGLENTPAPQVTAIVNARGIADAMSR